MSLGILKLFIPHFWLKKGKNFIFEKENHVVYSYSNNRDENALCHFR